jgi:hypothetical protein
LAVDERLVIPSIVGIVGLSLFTYCIGLSTGHLRANLLEKSAADGWRRSDPG